MKTRDAYAFKKSPLGNVELELAKQKSQIVAVLLVALSETGHIQVLNWGFHEYYSWSGFPTLPQASPMFSTEIHSLEIREKTCQLTGPTIA